jgi:hypothetical protein
MQIAKLSSEESMEVAGGLRQCAHGRALVDVLTACGKLVPVEQTKLGMPGLLVSEPK